MSGQASSELRRGEEREGVGKSRGGWEASRAVFLLPLGDDFVKAFWWTLCFSLASCVLRLASCLFGWLSRAWQYLLLSLVLVGVVAISISFLATRLVSSLTLPLFFFCLPFPLSAYCRSRLRTVFLTCILSPFEMHTRLPPPSPPLHYPLGPFRGNCGLGCFINRAVRVGFAGGGCDSMAGNATVFSLLLFASLAMVAHGGLVQATRRVGHSLAGRASD